MNYGHTYDPRGDVNGDGATDIVCQDPRAPDPHVDIWFGRRDMVFPEHADLDIPNNGTGYFGSWITSNIDFNGDGYDDVWIGGGGGNIYFGGNPMDTIVDLVLTGWGSYGENFYGGDFNGDGYGDYVAGVDYGYVIYYGGPDPPSSIASYRIPHGLWGGSAVVGDFNGDGADDFVVYGAYGWIRYLRHPHPISAIQPDPSAAATPPDRRLLSLYPNPATDGTLRYNLHLPWKGHLRLEVFDLTGRRIAGLINREVVPGYLEDTWSGDGVPVGCYFLRMRYARETTPPKAAVEEVRAFIWSPRESQRP